MRCVRQEHASQKTWRSAHTCPMCCDKIPPIFLTAPPSYEPIICHLRRCEKHLRDGKLATSSLEIRAVPIHEIRRVVAARQFDLDDLRAPVRQLPDSRGSRASAGEVEDFVL